MFLKKLLKEKQITHRVDYAGYEEEPFIIEWNSQVIDDSEHNKSYIVEIGEPLVKKEDTGQQVHFKTTKEVKEFSDGIVFEFNNILNSLIGYTSFLKKYFQHLHNVGF